MSVADGSVAGANAYDSENYRTYLVYGGHVSEFYASDQTSPTNTGGQKHDAVRSSDYDSNTGQQTTEGTCGND